MDWKTLLAYITGSVDQELLLRNEYLVMENRLLRKQITGRVRLNDSERKTFCAVQATQYQGECSAKNYGFVDAVARKNVELTITDINRRSAVLADLESSGAIRIVGAMYNIETGLLEFLG